MLDAQQMISMHDEANRAWHHDQPFQAQITHPMMLNLMLQHRANFDLWHEEDKARRAGASHADLAAVKHAIDELNQERNDYVEQIDSLLLQQTPTQNEHAPFILRPPGLIIDRLSILSLKIYHTLEETIRDSATNAHHARNRERLDILRQQRTDLAQCLDDLWDQISRGERRFKLYRQMKMYNDPDLNPELYGTPT